MIIRIIVIIITSVDVNVKERAIVWMELRGCKSLRGEQIKRLAMEGRRKE
jgi:hypothetical protein